SARASSRRGCCSTPGRRNATPRRASCSGMPSIGSISPAAATRASVGSRAPSRRWRVPRPCAPSMSPRRLRTAHPTSSAMSELAAAGLVVVSGLARGIDAEAHRGTLDAGGATVAVLGCGIDRDYPASHAELARRIAASGLIVSEYAPGVEPAPWRFPARNRIVSGLSDATVVVEARERSGALITADLALDEGRDVLAVPRAITSGLSPLSSLLFQPSPVRDASR